jgi:hypothetical protein
MAQKIKISFFALIIGLIISCSSRLNSRQENIKAIEARYLGNKDSFLKLAQSHSDTTRFVNRSFSFIDSCTIQLNDFPLHVDTIDLCYNSTNFEKYSWLRQLRTGLMVTSVVIGEKRTAFFFEDIDFPCMKLVYDCNNRIIDNTEALVCSECLSWHYSIDSCFSIVSESCFN